METKRFVTMRCTVCGADCFSDGANDCDCDAHDYGRFMTANPLQGDNE
jgi:hypothetical protein